MIGIEKNGHRVPKSAVGLSESGALSDWPHLEQVFTSLQAHQTTKEALLEKAMQALNDLSELLPESAALEFLQSQLALLLTTPTGLRYSKNLFVFAAELFGISPSAYKMLRESRLIKLPAVPAIRRVLSSGMDSKYLHEMFAALPPKQRLVNVVFDEVKLRETHRYSGGHLLGHAENRDQLAGSALVIELVCLHGGPKLVHKVHPVRKLTSEQQKKMVEEALDEIKDCGGIPVSLVADNCAHNQSTFKLMGGPGRVEYKGTPLFLMYDYVHVYKNVRNNWVGEKTQELEFSDSCGTHTAKWSDLRKLHKEDTSRNTPLMPHLTRMTTLNHTAVQPKQLQKQNVQLVQKVFNEKTPAAMEALNKGKPVTDKYDTGTIMFLTLISDWFKIMSVKQPHSGIRLRDDLRQPWKLGCKSFSRLREICKVIQSCRSPTARGRVKQLTQMTADAFVTTTLTMIEAAEYLMTVHGYEYVLPGTFSQDPLEAFFGHARQRAGGNFYIDVVDVLAAAKVQHLRALMRLDIVPHRETCVAGCPQCMCPPNIRDYEACEVTLQDTLELLESDTAEKEKSVFIAGFLTRKYRQATGSEADVDDDSEPVSCAFLEELDRGGLTVPTVSTVHMVHYGTCLFDQLPEENRRCQKYLAKLLSMTDAPVANCPAVCQSLAHLLFKAHVLNLSDKEQQLGCLRRKEKLSGTA